MYVEKYHVCGKVPCMWKNTMYVEKYHVCGKVSCIWKSIMFMEKNPCIWKKYHVQWNLTNPNSLGPAPVRISEIFGLVQ